MYIGCVVIFAREASRNGTALVYVDDETTCALQQRTCGVECFITVSFVCVLWRHLTGEQPAAVLVARWRRTVDIQTEVGQLTVGGTLRKQKKRAATEFTHINACAWSGLLPIYQSFALIGP